MSVDALQPTASVRSLINLAESGAGELWAEATRVACLALGGDAAIGLKLLSDDRMQVAASFCWPRPLSGQPIPIAPDSQAAFVLTQPAAVITHVAHERRFTPSKLTIDAGFVDSCSARVQFGDTLYGLIGVQYGAPRRHIAADLVHLEVVASMLALLLSHEERLRRNARLVDHDALTGVLNRRGVFDALETGMSGRRTGCLLLLDLDGFKLVNDRHGHGVGDHVLQVVAERLQAAVRPSDLIGRLSGDEFVAVLWSTDVPSALEAAERLIGHLEQIITVPHATVSVSASVGVAPLDGYPNVLSLLHAADVAMYSAKAAGRGTAKPARLPKERIDTVTTSPMATARATSHGRHHVDHAVRSLGVVFQPIVDIASGDVTGVEALTRGPRGPLENPAVLFRLAETWGRLSELELESKRQSFEAALPRSLTLFVNIDPAALTAPGFTEQLLDIWNSSDPAGRTLVIELTERHLRVQPGPLLHSVDWCRSVGWKVALDDVGARAESLTALSLVQPDIVKLDISLINTMNKAHVAATALALAGYRDRRHIDVVAEGIENEANETVAHELGATHVQGYLYGRPAHADEIAPLLTRPRRTPITVGATAGLRRGRRSTLLAISRHIESLAGYADTIVLATIQSVENYTATTRSQYAALGRRCGMVGVVGVGLPPGVLDDVHTGNLASDDALARAWHVILLHPEGGTALLAYQSDPTDRSWYDYELTTDRDRIDIVARQILAHL